MTFDPSKRINGLDPAQDCSGFWRSRVAEVQKSSEATHRAVRDSERLLRDIQSNNGLYLRQREGARSALDEAVQTLRYWQRSPA